MRSTGLVAKHQWRHQLSPVEAQPMKYCYEAGQRQCSIHQSEKLHQLVSAHALIICKFAGIYKKFHALQCKSINVRSINARVSYTEACFALSFLSFSQRFSEETASCTLEIVVALRNRQTTISCFASASSTHLFTITYLMGVALSSDFFIWPYCELNSS